MTNAVAAIGTQLKMGDGAASEVFTKIAEVRSIQGPTSTFDVLDATSHDSLNNTREFVAGLIDPGELTFEVLFDPGAVTHDATTGLIAKHQARTETNFQLLFLDSTLVTFAALVTNFEPSEPHDDLQVASVTLKITGTITWA